MVQTEIECDECGKEATVPFKPSKDRPVYCKECFQKKKNSGGRRGKGGKKKQQRWRRSDYAGYDPAKHAPDQT